MTAEALLGRLRTHDTPTICNAIEVVLGRRCTTGFTTKQFVCVDPGLPPIVGYARTATIRAATPADGTPEQIRDTRLAYYDYIAQAPGPTVVLIQDLDEPPAFGAFWGEVNSAVHLGLGCRGVVTNGAIRDLDVVAPGFQMLAGQTGPSHALVHPVAFGEPVRVHGMDVAHGDLVHADRHGAVVIPKAVAPELLHGIDVMARKEKLLLDAARRPGFSVDDLRQAMVAGEDIH